MMGNVEMNNSGFNPLKGQIVVSDLETNISRLSMGNCMYVFCLK